MTYQASDDADSVTNNEARTDGVSLSQPAINVCRSGRISVKCVYMSDMCAMRDVLLNEQSHHFLSNVSYARGDRVVVVLYNLTITRLYRDTVLE